MIHPVGTLPSNAPVCPAATESTPVAIFNTIFVALTLVAGASFRTFLKLCITGAIRIALLLRTILIPFTAIFKYSIYHPWWDIMLSLKR